MKQKVWYKWIAFQNNMPYGGFWNSKKSIEEDGWNGKSARLCKIVEVSAKKHGSVRVSATKRNIADGVTAKVAPLPSFRRGKK